MRIGSYELKLEKRITLKGWQAATISILAIICALALFSVIFILARVLSRKPRLLIANLPTQGLDIGATEFVRNHLMEAKKEKAGILLISEDLDEVLSLSDWVAPIYEGEFMGIIPGEEAKRESVGAMMAGSRLEGSET